MNSILNVENIEFSYDKASLLEDIDFNVPSGSFVSILGPNGSGKTTLLKNLCGLLSPRKGTISLRNRKIGSFKHKEFAKTVAVVHQSSNVGFSFSVFDTVLMGRFPYIKKLQGETTEDIKAAEEAMKSTGVWHLREKDIREISGGERQRVMIARALTQEPELLILDEPISNLDIKFQINILQVCKKLNKEKGITIVTTLHDINLAGQYSDYILLLNKGKLVSQDEPKNVLTVENIEKVYEIKVELLNRDGHEFPYIVPQTSLYAGENIGQGEHK